jgi:exonuclease SbcD
VDVGDRLVEGVREVYAEVFEALRARRKPTQALVAMGHCYMTGGDLSMLSERKILGGNQHALPVDIFPEDLAYVALGHLHRAQMVGGREGVRYSGSPIPLSLPEAPYHHQVNIVDIEGAALHEIRSVRIPRAVNMLKVPANGPLPLDEVLPLLAKLDVLDPASPMETRPYLEVEVLVRKPEASLRRSIEQALVGKSARLVRLLTQQEGTGLPLADAYASASLKQLQAEEVFRQCYFKTYRDDPTPDLLEAFHDLLELVEAEAL